MLGDVREKGMAEDRQKALGAPCTVFCEEFVAPRGPARERRWKARKHHVHAVLFFARVFEPGSELR